MLFRASSALVATHFVEIRERRNGAALPFFIAKTF
jgi:hypothetical protein